MFTHPATVPSAPVPTSTSATSPTSSRTGRLRGLSYLRSYTQNHLSSHSSHLSNSPSQRNSLQRSTSYPADRSSNQGSTNGLANSAPEQQSPQSITTGVPPSSQAESVITSGWLPTVGGLSGLSRVAPQPQPTSAAAPSSPVPTPTDDTDVVNAMARHRAESTPLRARVGAMLPSPSFSTDALNFSRLQSTVEVGKTSSSSRSQEPSSNGQNPTSSQSQPLPTIRFIPHQDPRSARPSLTFAPISRTLPDSNSVIKIGRYSERDANPTPAPNTPSAALVGFKSKVVSRKHCEFWCSNGQWYVKDVKSSSGTFLNHIRLSQPNAESRPYPVNDGDVVQLGIDFRGGEEMIFRCVKIRVECNRAWQKGLNSFKYVLCCAQTSNYGTTDIL